MIYSDYLIYLIVELLLKLGQKYVLNNDMKLLYDLKVKGWY